mmetsp:Transcript_1233/g.3589  ORF Transcript_1233/g.3589 Transcript_1233/m.3589 type:complete len:209 (+) Transcript_1233:1434-2060(+)
MKNSRSATSPRRHTSSPSAKSTGRHAFRKSISFRLAVRSSTPGAWPLAPERPRPRATSRTTSSNVSMPTLARFCPPPLARVEALSLERLLHSNPNSASSASMALSTHRSASSNEPTRTATSRAPCCRSVGDASSDANVSPGSTCTCRARSASPGDTSQPRVATPMSSWRSVRASSRSSPEMTSVIPLLAANCRILLKTLSAEPSTPTT